MSRLKVALIFTVFCAPAFNAAAKNQDSQKATKPSPALVVKKIEKEPGNLSQAKKRKAPAVQAIGAAGLVSHPFAASPQKDKPKPIPKSE